MIREVAEIHKHKAKLKAVFFIILVNGRKEGPFFPVSQQNHDSEAQPPHVFMKLWTVSFKGEAQLQ